MLQGSEDLLYFAASDKLQQQQQIASFGCSASAEDGCGGLRRRGGLGNTSTAIELEADVDDEELDAVLFAPTHAPGGSAAATPFDLSQGAASVVEDIGMMVAAADGDCATADLASAAESVTAVAGAAAGGGGGASCGKPAVACGGGTEWSACQEFLEHLASIQQSYRPNPRYIEMVQAPHTGMTPEWRWRLVEWLADVIADFRFADETLATAINYMDRYMSVVPVPMDSLQLLGITCCFTASKLTERKPLSMHWIATSCNTVNVEDVKCLERHVLDTLGWGMMSVVPHTALNALLQFVPTEHVRAIRCRSEALLKVAFCDYAVLNFDPVTLAVCAILAAHSLSCVSPTQFSSYLGHLSLGLESASVAQCQQLLLSSFCAYCPEFTAATCPWSVSPTTVTDVVSMSREACVNI